MKIGVIGMGVVGSAVYKAFEPYGDMYAYDKYKAEYPLDKKELKSCDLLFICVPTLTDNGYQKLQPLIETFAYLKSIRYKGVVVSKCTTLPGNLGAAIGGAGLRVVHNPEFLTAATPYLDFVNSPTCLLSGHPENTSIVARAYRTWYKGPFLVYRRWAVTEMAKYMHNLFLALKVGFANEMYEAAQYTGLDYEQVRIAALSAGGIGAGHTRVPGPDGQAGFGGMCFPKDTEAWVGWAKYHGVAVDTVEAAVKGNNKRRGKK